MDYKHITSQRQLTDFCNSLRDAPLIGFDTEFVSEDTYRPDLCLIQVAAGDRMAVIDPKAVDDVTPFWELITSPGHETIVHAGREEFRFCLTATGKRPHNLFDIQIAAALIGLEYPAAYGTLVRKMLNGKLHKGETRSDWRRRPLSQRQLEYALDDVVYLEPLRNALVKKIENLKRRMWLESEMTDWQASVEHAESEERWRRVSGIASLSSRALAIVRELFRWRDEEANRRNRPAKRILRDDLLVELAKRQSADPKRISAIRGMERRELKNQYAEIAKCVDRALSLADSQCPRPQERSRTQQLNALGQFLTTALGSISRAAKVAPGLVGTSQDVRELVAHHLGLEQFDEPPALSLGWRAEVVGQQIEKLIKGELCLRITDPLSDHPLAFEPAEPQDSR